MQLLKRKELYRVSGVNITSLHGHTTNGNVSQDNSPYKRLQAITKSETHNRLRNSHTVQWLEICKYERTVLAK